MANKKKRTARTPPGNRPQAGPPDTSKHAAPEAPPPPDGAPFQEQDVQRRLGNYQGSGEHAIQQPGGKKDSDH